VNKQKEKFNGLNTQIEGENDRKIKLGRRDSEHEASIEKEKADLITKEKTLSTRQRAINDHVSNIRQRESEKQLNNERLRFSQRRASSLRDQIDQDKKSANADCRDPEPAKRRISAQGILTEISQKAESIKAEFETQKIATAQLQVDVDALRQQRDPSRKSTFRSTKVLKYARSRSLP